MSKKFFLAGLMITFAAFFFALAMTDFSIMHMQWDRPNWLYKYWISLGLVVTVFAFTLSYAIWTAGFPNRYAYATFLTIILLYAAGLLDLFYYMLATFHGESYSFQYWSAQWKWFVENGVLPTWDWPRQIVWTLGCLIAIVLIWKRTLK